MGRLQAGSRVRQGIAGARLVHELDFVMKFRGSSRPITTSCSKGLDRVLGRVRDALLAASHRSAAAPPQAAAKDSA